MTSLSKGDAKVHLHICLSLPTSPEIQPAMQPVTPLRRSDRLRHANVINSSPSSSPGTAAYLGPSRSRVFSSPGGQTDSDTTLWGTTSSNSSGSGTEDTLGDDGSDAMALVALTFPPKLSAVYEELVPMLDYSRPELMKTVSLLSVFFPMTNPHSSHSFPTPTLSPNKPRATQDIPRLNSYLKDLNTFLIDVIHNGLSQEWPEFNAFVQLCHRINEVIHAKKAKMSPQKRKQYEEVGCMGNGLEFSLDSKSVSMKGKHWQRVWRDTENAETVNRRPTNFGWNDAGASGSRVSPPDTTNALDFPYPRARTLDYCTIPNTYH